MDICFQTKYQKLWEYWEKVLKSLSLGNKQEFFEDLREIQDTQQSELLIE